MSVDKGKGAGTRFYFVGFLRFFSFFLCEKTIYRLLLKSENVVLGVVVLFHIYPPFTRKRIVSLYFGRHVRTRLGVAIFEVSGPPVFHIKAGASR